LDLKITPRRKTFERSNVGTHRARALSKAVYLQETLLLFRQLLAYHDPPLAAHLISIGFQPDL
jgi:hypothetical protein